MFIRDTYHHSLLLHLAWEQMETPPLQQILDPIRTPGRLSVSRGTRRMRLTGSYTTLRPLLFWRFNREHRSQLEPDLVVVIKQFYSDY